MPAGWKSKTTSLVLASPVAQFSTAFSGPSSFENRAKLIGSARGDQR